MKSYAAFALIALAIFGCSNSNSPATSSSASSDATPTPSTVTRVLAVAAEQMGVDQSNIEASTSLADLGADELDLVELVMTLEEEFDQTISDAEIERMSGGEDLSKGFGELTMADLAKLVDD